MCCAVSTPEHYNVSCLRVTSCGLICNELIHINALLLSEPTHTPLRVHAHASVAPRTSSAVDKAELLLLQKEYNRLTSRAPDARLTKDSFNEGMEIVGLFDAGGSDAHSEAPMLGCVSTHVCAHMAALHR